MPPEQPAYTPHSTFNNVSASSSLCFEEAVRHHCRRHGLILQKTSFDWCPSSFCRRIPLRTHTCVLWGRCASWTVDRTERFATAALRPLASWTCHESSPLVADIFQSSYLCPAIGRLRVKVGVRSPQQYTMHRATCIHVAG